MKKNYCYSLSLAGMIAFSTTSYAALDCAQYANPNTAQACKVQNETTLSVREKGEAQLEKIQSAEKIVLQKLAPGSVPPPTVLAEEKTQATSEAVPQKTDLQTVPPAFEYTPPPRVPNQPPSPTNGTSANGAGQQNNRIKYY